MIPHSHGFAASPHIESPHAVAVQHFSLTPINRSVARTAIKSTRTPVAAPCSVTRAARADLAAALVETQDLRVLRAGDMLIGQIDAGCE
jgi:hypothetical protein